MPNIGPSTEPKMLANRVMADGGWNHKALIALAISGVLSIGLSLLGAYGVIFKVGDWGWLIGASTGALADRILSTPARSLSAAHAGE